VGPDGSGRGACAKGSLGGEAPSGAQAVSDEAGKGMARVTSANGTTASTAAAAVGQLDPGAEPAHDGQSAAEGGLGAAVVRRGAGVEPGPGVADLDVHLRGGLADERAHRQPDCAPVQPLEAPRALAREFARALWAFL
jgi:hypothetical protein